MGECGMVELSVYLHSDCTYVTAYTEHGENI